jgi:hypothetical protein
MRKLPKIRYVKSLEIFNGIEFRFFLLFSMINEFYLSNIIYINFDFMIKRFIFVRKKKIETFIKSNLDSK